MEESLLSVASDESRKATFKNLRNHGSWVTNSIFYFPIIVKMADSNENQTNAAVTSTENDGVIHCGDPEAVPHIGKEAVDHLLVKFARPQTDFLPDQLDLSQECPKGLVANMKSQYGNK